MEKLKDDLDDPSISSIENNFRTLVIGRLLRDLKGLKKGDDKLLERRGREIALKAAIERWEKSQK
jgi:hypothetical protein